MAGPDAALRPGTCLGCGCACDDIRLALEGGRIVEARNACSLGAAWFGDGIVPALVRVDGRDTTVDRAIDAAAQFLHDAARVLVYLAPDVSCETQREVVAVADRLRATLDSITSTDAMRSVLSAQTRGRATATLGEIRNRADVVVFWGVDSAHRYPRYATRYAPEPPGAHVPEGRRSRTVVAVDVGEARGPEDADRRVAVPAGHEVAVLTMLAAAVADTKATKADATKDTMAAATKDTKDTKVAMGAAAIDACAGELASILLGGRYVVVVAEVDSGPGLDPGRGAALIALAQALNGATRGALSLLRAGGNRSGADAVMTWQTGYPMAVDFSRGFPRYRPHDGSAAARLARGDVDAVLVAGAARLIPADLLDQIARVPHAVIGPRSSESPLANGRAAIDTGVAGIHEPGMAVRMDDVPLPLHAVVPGPADTTTIVRALRDRIGSLLSPSSFLLSPSS